MSEENKKAELPAHRDKRFDGVRDTWYWKLSKPVRVVVHFVIRTRGEMQRGRDCISKRDQDQCSGASVQYPGEVPAGNDRFCSDTDLQELGTVSGRWK